MTPAFWVVLGPTAVGKTETSLLIADTIDVEIVNLDSRQVYRRLDIGTAKPTKAERSRVPHHLIDIIEPDERLDAVSYAHRARACILEIRERNRTPLVVGGTGFYLNAILGEFSEDLPARDEMIRARLMTTVRKDGIEALWKRLESIDPETAGRLNSTDTARIVRALEIFEASGSTLSELGKKHPPKPWGSPRIAVLYRERSLLKRRIRERIDRMLKGGWMEEVRSLLREGFKTDSPAMNGLGYRELVEVSRGTLEIDAARDAICHRTWRYAKRQLTWFRRYPDEWWFDADDPNLTGMLLRYFQAAHT